MVRDLHEPIVSPARFDIDPCLWAALQSRLRLTPRQAEILELTLRGHGVKQVAAQLGLKLPTVRTHLSRLFFRLSVRDRSELILLVFCEAQALWRDGLSFNAMTSA